MKTEELKIKFPVGFEQAIHITKDEVEQHIRLMAALKMFELGKISSGKASELAGISKTDFFETCSRYRVSILNYSPEDIEHEIENDLTAFKEKNEK